MTPGSAAQCPICNEPGVSQVSECPYFADSDHNDAAIGLAPGGAQDQVPEPCGAVHDRGPGERPRRVTCKNPKGHDGQHFAVWGGSQKWRQMNWSDEPKTGVPQPLYIVVRVDDEIEDVQSMLVQLTEFGEQVTLNVGPYRFTKAEIVRKGTVAP